MGPYAGQRASPEGGRRGRGRRAAREAPRARRTPGGEPALRPRGTQVGRLVPSGPVPRPREQARSAPRPPAVSGPRRRQQAPKHGPEHSALRGDAPGTRLPPSSRRPPEGPYPCSSEPARGAQPRYRRPGEPGAGARARRPSSYPEAGLARSDASALGAAMPVAGA